MTARLMMDRESNGVPHDRAGELTGWVYLDTVPAAADGERFPARAYGAGGYLATDEANRFTGLAGISAHAIIAPDYDAMIGQGPRALLYRGHGGPTAAQYWAWGIEVERVGSTLEVRGVHQDQAGLFQSVTIATIGIGIEWIALAVSRERTATGFEWRAWLNGELAGEVQQASTATSTPGQPITLGARVIAAGTTERSWLGRIERVLVNESAATSAQVRWEYHTLIGAYEDAYAIWAAYLPSAFPSTPDTAYGRYRVRPMAEMLAMFDSSARRFEEAALPPGAYGEHLAAFEQALGLTPSATATIAQRQAATQAALAGVQDLSPSSLQELAAILFGVPTGDVTILEGANYRDITVTGSGELTGPPWRVLGPADVTSEVGGLTIGVPAGRDIRHVPYTDRAVFVDLAIHHLVDRESDHGLAVTFQSAVGLQEDTWCGISLMAQNGAVWWVALDAGGLVLRSYDVETGLSARTVVDALVAAPVELVTEWTGAAWTVRYRAPGSGPGNWTEFDLVAPLGALSWCGVSVSSALASTLLDVLVVVSAVIAKAGDADSWAEWQAYDTDPVYRDIIAHSVELDAKGRAASRGSATYSLELRADTDGSSWSYTPTQVYGVRVPAIADTSSEAAQTTGIFPTNMWRFQEAAAPVLDVLGTVDLAEVAPAATYQVAGPDVYAVEFSNGTNALQAALAGDLDVSGNSLFMAGVFYVSGTGLIVGKEQTATIGWRMQRNVSSFTLRISNGVNTATATVTDGASGFALNTWSAFALLVQDAGGGTARVALALSTASGSAQTTSSTSNTGQFSFGAGQGGNAAAYRIRWAQATLGGEADGLAPADIATAAARIAAATGVA